MTQQNTLHRWSLMPILAVAALSAQAGQASAQACESYGTKTSSSYTDGTLILNAGDTAAVTVSGSANVYLYSGSPENVNLRASTFSGASSVSYTSATDGMNIYIYTAYILNDANVSSSIVVSCTPAAPEAASDTIVSQAATVSAASQSRAIANGLTANSRSRLGAGGSNTVSRSGMFFSTQNATRSALETAEYNLWVSGELRNFNGGLDGFSADLTLGVDRLITENTLAGLLLAYGRTDLDDGLGEATVDSPAIGAYFASRFAGDLILDAYLAYARPETETAGTTFKSDRVSAGMMLSGQYALSTGTMRPFARLNASVEDQPAYTGTNGPVAATDLRSYTASVGTRFESAVALGSTGLLPYISGAIDYGYTDNGLSASDDFFYPRIGFGVAGPIGAGYFALDVDAGKARSDTYDVGLRLTYEAKF